MRIRDEFKIEAIRQCAVEMVAKHGLDCFSMGKLAKEAQVSPATIYIYYKDREDLIIQLCTTLSSDLLLASLKDFDPEMKFAEGLRIQWKNRAEYFISHPLEMQFIEHIRYTPLYEKVSQNLTTDFKEVMGKFIHNAIKKKQLVKLPFEIYWSLAFAPLYQLIKFHSQGKSYASEKFKLNDKIMNQALELVVKALKP